MFFASPSIHDLQDAASQVGPGQFPVLLIGEHDPISTADLCAAFQAAGQPFIGGIFPRIIYGEETFDTGALLMSVPSESQPHVITNLHQPDWDQDKLPSLLAEQPCESVLVFIDGLTPEIGNFLAVLYGRLGANVAYFGGGAGSLSLKQAPAILTPDGVLQDAAVVLPIKGKANLGVHHGWQRLAGPLVASRTEKNVIMELNWRNAFDVYRETVEPAICQNLGAENFFDHAKGFPFGMSRDGCEDIVRDPITVTEDGYLVCVGDVAQHSMLYILSGQPNDLITAAAKAGRACPTARPGQFMLIDCISRNLFLAEQFAEELMAVKRGNALPEETMLEGALTLGEISSIGGGYLEFLNKTIVFVAFENGGSA